MSLINQVLQDLDRRHAGVGEFSNARSVLPWDRPSRFPRWMAMPTALLMSTLLLGAVVLAWQNTSGEALPRATAAAVPQPLSPPVISLAAITAVAAPAMPAGDVPAAGSAASALDAPAAATTPGSGSELETSALTLAGDGAEPFSRVARLDDPGFVKPGSASVFADAAPTDPAPAPQLEAHVEKRVQPWTGHERAEAEYQRGLALHERGQARDAAAAFVSALQDDRRHTASRHAAAVELVGLGRLEEARRLLAEGLELQPHQIQLALTLARVKVDQNNLPGAIDVLKAALSGAATGTVTGAEPAQARALLATLQQRNGQHSEAIENYAAALRQVPGSGAWWIGMGISLAADGREDSAREAFTRARSTETLSPELEQYVEQRLRSTPH